MIQQPTTVVLCTGGFDPIHSGHVAYFKNAARFGQQLIIGLNSDQWLRRKKGREFMPWAERAAIIQELRPVASVIEFNDDDGTAIDAIRRVRKQYPYAKIFFANGGDRTQENIPEMSIEDDRVEFLFGIGGTNKANSSSWILKAWQEPIRTNKPWGYYTVLEEVNSNVKVKKLHVLPGKSLSLQRHFKRSEYWFVASGRAFLETEDSAGNLIVQEYELHEHIHIPVTKWHRLFNTGDIPVEIVEIQYGPECQEEDIERR